MPWLETIRLEATTWLKMGHTTVVWDGVGKTVQYKQEQP